MHQTARLALDPQTPASALPLKSPAPPLPQEPTVPSPPLMQIAADPLDSPLPPPGPTESLDAASLSPPPGPAKSPAVAPLSPAPLAAAHQTMFPQTMIPPPTALPPLNPNQTTLLKKSHTFKPDNPCHIHHLISKFKLECEVVDSQFSFYRKTTTLRFSTSRGLSVFAQELPASTFGKNATYSFPDTFCARRPVSRPRRHAWQLMSRQASPQPS